MIERFCASVQSHLHGLSIHDPRTFAAVLTLGILQTIVAVDSSWLAVKALDKLSPIWRRLQIISIVAVGGAIVVVSLLIGYLADSSQAKADKRADIAEQSLILTRSGLDNAQGKLDLISQKADRKVCTPEDTAVLRDELKSVQQSITAARLASNPVSISVNGHPLAAVPPPPAPSPSVHPVDARSVQQDIHETLAELQRIDTNTNQVMTFSSMSGIRSDYRQAWSDYAQSHPGQPTSIDPDTQKRLDREFQGIRPQLQKFLDQRDEDFQNLLPRIRLERMHALQLLKLSNREQTTDAAAFNAGYADATEKIQIPDSWLKAGYLYDLNFQPMESYLASLEQRLGTAQ